MSIYEYSERINTQLNRAIIRLDKVKIVASSSKNKLTFDNYNKENLDKFVKKYKHATIHPYFWRIDYSINMIDMDEEIFILDEPDTYMVNVDYFEKGKMIMFIVFFNVLCNTFEYKNTTKYQEYLRELNIDKNVFANFLINNIFYFPLTENYFTLIKRIFTNDNIIDYIFKTDYNQDQIFIILQEFNYGSLNNLSKHIFNSKLNDKDKLCLCQKLIGEYNDNIDTNKEVLLSMKNFKPYLIYYLYTMNISDELVNSYYYTWNLVLDNGGACKLTIIDDNKLNDKLRQRYEVIKDNFNL